MGLEVRERGVMRICPFFNFSGFPSQLKVPFFALYCGERKIGLTARKDTENGTA